MFFREVDVLQNMCSYMLHKNSQKKIVPETSRVLFLLKRDYDAGIFL